MVCPVPLGISTVCDTVYSDKHPCWFFNRGSGLEKSQLRFWPGACLGSGLERCDCRPRKWWGNNIRGSRRGASLPVFDILNGCDDHPFCRT
jgi:hypothetical protein